MGRPPVDLTKVSASTLYPEGRFRVRVVSTKEYPENEEYGPDGELPGKTTQKGNQAYAWMRCGFRFMEHPSNVAPDPKSGEPIDLAGRQIWKNYSYHPNFMSAMRQLYDAAGVSPDQDYEALHGNELDVTIKNKPSYEDAEVLESVVTATRVAVG